MRALQYGVSPVFSVDTGETPVLGKAARHGQVAVPRVFTQSSWRVNQYPYVPLR